MTETPETCIVCEREPALFFAHGKRVGRKCAHKLGDAILMLTRDQLAPIWSVDAGEGYLGPEHLRRAEVREVWFREDQDESNAQLHAKVALTFMGGPVVSLDVALVEAAVALNMPLDVHAWDEALRVLFDPRVLQEDHLVAMRALMLVGI